MKKNLQFSNTLILWYLINKRDLPWRNTTDPYLIWLSEIILQQTKIAQGTSYYLKFFKEFNNIFYSDYINEDMSLNSLTNFREYDVPCAIFVWC